MIQRRERERENREWRYTRAEKRRKFDFCPLAIRSSARVVLRSFSRHPLFFPRIGVNVASNIIVRRTPPPSPI